MKRWIVVAGIVAIAVAVALVWQSQPPVDEAPEPGEQSVLGVHELMRNVDRYRDGPTQVKGVVSYVSAEGQGLTLIDVVDFEECGLCDCAPLKLPIRWSGAMPHLQDTVLIEGEVQEAAGKLIFVARSVEPSDARTGTPE
jgi:hypothetical protein